MRTQRDVYANLNNQSLHYANQGVTINEIHNVYEVPKSLQQQWAARSYHGSEQNNARGVINRFLGHWDGNPATLVPLSPSDSAPLYVEMMGGSEKIMAKGRELMGQGKYLHAVEILDRLVFAEPKNQPARDLLADAYEQLGYQKESPSLRNSFLQGAYELRSGMPTGTAPSTGSADVIRSMPTGFWLDFLGISMDPKRAEGLRLAINLVTPDNGEKYLIELSNATLTNIEGVQAPKPDLTLTVNRADLNRVMMGVATFDQLAQEGKARFDGDRTAIYKLRDLLVTFTPDFEFIPGSAPERRQVPPGRPFVLPEPVNVMGE
jgi:alkyl sulfatase BDS1-like metallo-beta-lactamase superfamily hydrolase